MSGFRITAVGIVGLFWTVVLLLWMIGLGYEAHGFRLPVPGSDGLADVLLFYAPLVTIGWLVSKPLKQKMRPNAPNN